MQLAPLRRRLMFALPLAAWASARAQSLPPLRILVGAPPGGSTDTLAREIAPEMGRRLGRTVIVENRSGAGGNLAAEAVARAAPDGATLLYGTAENLAINPHIYRKVAYDALRDFSAVGVVGHFPFGLVVNPKLPGTTLADFIEHAKRQPGKLNYASWGVGSTSQIAFEQFRQVTGTNLVHVPFQGAAPAITALAGGQVDAFLVPLSVAVPQARSGRVRLLGVSTAERVASATEVPTLAEQGVPVVIGGWHVIVAPKATPREALAQLHSALNAALAGRELRDTLAKQGITPAPGSAAEAEAMLQPEWQRWGRVARAAAITVE